MNLRTTFLFFSSLLLLLGTASCSRSMEDKFRATVENRFVEDGQTFEIISIQLMDSAYFRNADWMKSKQQEIQGLYDKLATLHAFYKCDLGKDTLLFGSYLETADLLLDSMQISILDFYGESLSKASKFALDYQMACWRIQPSRYGLRDYDNRTVYRMEDLAIAIEDEVRTFGYGSPYSGISAMSDSGLPGYMSNRLWETTKFVAYGVTFRTGDGKEKVARMIWQREVEEVMNEGIIYEKPTPVPTL